MIRAIERRIAAIEERHSLDAQALAEAGQRLGSDHRSREELIAAIRAKVAEMLTFRTMAQLRTLMAGSRFPRLCLQVLDIIEREGPHHATH